MRALWIVLPLMMAASPAAAQPSEVTLPPEIADPALADRVGHMMGKLTRSLLDLPVGEIEAAIEGREPGEMDRGRTLRDRVGGEQAERQVEAGIAASTRTMQAVSKALISSLPALMASLEGIEADIERATANLPDPTYPKR